MRENPMKMDFGLKLDVDKTRQQDSIVKPLVTAACGENHVLLQRAWKAVIDAGMPAEAVAVLTKPPFNERTAFELGAKYEAADREVADKMLADWSADFRSRYEKVLSSVGG
jgi:hypothetical protein